MKYFNSFLMAPELKTLRACVASSYSPITNNIKLSELSEINRRISSLIYDLDRIEVEFLSAYVFLACSTTMERFKENGGWHTDASCRSIDGICYNAWIPVYVDSTNTGIDVITEKDNESFYKSIGDPTQPIMVLSRMQAEDLFLITQADASDQFIAINQSSGSMVPFSLNNVTISNANNPKSGDLCLFKQTELHRGFHLDGVRIQLSLKFVAKNAKLNNRSTNTHYNLYRRLGRECSIHAFEQAKDFFSSKKELSKHGRLEAELVKALLSGNMGA